VKTWKDPSSPWGEKAWYEEDDFEAIMTELRERAGNDLFTQGDGLDIETLLARVYKVEPDYAADLPPGTLGRTSFFPDGHHEIEVQRALAEEAGSDTTARRRLRSTLAHECAHITLHGPLHAFDTRTLDLFGTSTPSTPRVLCRSTTIDGSRRQTGPPEWWEVQANRGMSTLLLPKDLVLTTTTAVLGAMGCGTMTHALATRRGKEVLDELTVVFDTSFEMTLYRLQGLGLIPEDDKQHELAI
jgi:hypothetical protein